MTKMRELMLACSSLACVAALASPATAAAQEQAQEAKSYSVGAGSLANGLSALASQTGLSLVYPAALAEGRTTRGVSGEMLQAEALARVLAGTGLTFRFTDSRTVVIEPSVEGADGERVLGAVRVEGVHSSGAFGVAGQQAGVNGINGSRDITATEGTGSYTSGALTIGSKTPRAIKDTVQSVSVLTNQRMQDQNVVDLDDAMRQLPGVSLIQSGTGLDYDFISRGFEISTYQVDGGAPFQMKSIPGTFVQTIIDMSQYDHVELLRGAAGLFSGYGAPSGIVNLVRKKPLDHGQVAVEGQIGSWDLYRTVADVSGPLTSDGKLRGRMVLTFQKNNYFYDLANDERFLIYGIGEYDLTPTTLMTFGINYTHQDSLPDVLGLPRYENGDDLELPRHTSFTLPWNRIKLRNTQIFGSIDQNIGSNWHAKLDLTYNKQLNQSKYATYLGPISPSTQLGVPLSDNGYQSWESQQVGAEFTLSGNFSILGQRQEILIGGNYARGGPPAGVPRSYFTFASIGPALNPFDFNPNSYPEPANALPRAAYVKIRQINYGFYASGRFTAFDKLHLETGIRLNGFDYYVQDSTLCRGLPSQTLCAGKQIGDPYQVSDPVSRTQTSITWPPAISLSYDISKNLTSYIGYTDIHQDQSNYLTFDGSKIDPITGYNREIGLKWSSGNRKINISISAYDVKRSGYAANDPRAFNNGSFFFDEDGNPYTIDSNGTRYIYGLDPAFVYSCCYKGDENRYNKSKGFDFDITGEVTEGLQISANYTYTKSSSLGYSDAFNDGRAPLYTRSPKHLAKLYAHYDFGEDGLLRGLALSGGVNFQSEGYFAGFVCTAYLPPDPLGNVVCDYAGGASKAYAFIQPSRAIVSLGADYNLSKNYSLSLKLDNVFDKTYYETVGSSGNSNRYGAPRNFTLTLRGKW